jgi:hypothetical protein
MFYYLSSNTEHILSVDNFFPRKARNNMIISTLVNDIRSEDHVCLSPLSVQKTQIPASQKLLKMPVE